LPQQVIEMPPNVQAVKQFIVEHTKWVNRLNNL
jgi:hypothetical protein